MSIELNKKAPDFSLYSDSEEKITLKRFKGKKIVIFFYPKDNTPGCTKESCGFNDHLKQFNKHNTVVLGISKDSIKSHQKFRDKFDFNFPLLSDEDGSVCEKFGVWVEKSMYGRKYMGIERSTFLIDEQGKVQQVWHKVKVPGHVEAVLEAVSQ